VFFVLFGFIYGHRLLVVDAKQMWKKKRELRTEIKNGGDEQAL
jgi:hypothetical protein